MSTFVLVHGAWHGGWCWERLIPELAARGHASIAVDLPVEEGSATFETYAQVVVDAATAAEHDVVLVGHSLGSMVIPIVAAARPVAAMVFLCGVIPNFGGTPWDDAPTMDAPGTFDGLVQHEDGSTSWSDLDAATNAFYADCSPEDAAWAYSHLRRQNATSLWSTAYPLDAWPPGRRIAIIGATDRAVTPDYANHVCHTRLDVDPMELPGGHSPFLARPAELADALILTTSAVDDRE
jgi:pimeloyl-ACP methyl ester carboxylesterase